MKFRKITALLAAIAIACSMFGACGKNDAEDGAESDVSINVISDGTAAYTSPDDIEGENVTTTTGEFVDPAAQLGIDVGDDEEDTAPSETTVPVNHDDIASMVLEGTTAPKQSVVKDYSVDCTTRYGYNQLNDAEKALYKAILEGAQSLRLKVAVDDSVTDEMWIKVYGCVYMQEPQLFWLTSKKVQKGKLWYWETDPELIKTMQSEINKKASEVVSSASGKSTFDQLKIFHDFIALNNDFEKTEGFNQTIYGGFVLGTVQCEGYAKTMQYLCDLAGIESMVVVGTNSEGASHAWNVVKVDGEWYNLDTTWDDPILSVVDKTNVRYNYFLVPDEWIHNKSHFNINQKITGTKVTYFNPPACKAEKYNYFAQTGKLYSDVNSADKAIKEAMKTAAASKLRVAEIRVSSKSVYDSITANLKDYANWIKEQNSSVTKVTSNCDPNTLIIELDLVY
ncbi:MAG: transglutaminase domain-containing protein [Huintestinicola sp.]